MTLDPEAFLTKPNPVVFVQGHSNCDISSQQPINKAVGRVSDAYVNRTAISIFKDSQTASQLSVEDVAYLSCATAQTKLSAPSHSKLEEEAVIAKIL